MDGKGKPSIPETPFWPRRCPPGSPERRSALRWRLGLPSPSGPWAPPRRVCAAQRVWPCSPGTRPWCGTGGSAAWRASPAAVSRTRWAPPPGWCWSCGNIGAVRCTSPWTPLHSECTVPRTSLEKHHKGPFLTCSTNPGNNLKEEKKGEVMFQSDKLESNRLCHSAAQLNTQKKEEPWQSFSSSQHYPHSQTWALAMKIEGGTPSMLENPGLGLSSSSGSKAGSLFCTHKVSQRHS